MLKLFISKYRQYLIGVCIAVVLLFSARWYINDVKDKAYTLGYNTSESAWGKRSDQYKIQIADLKSKNVDLNREISVLNEKYRDLEAENKKKVDNLLTEYKKKPTSGQEFKDKDFINIYNRSLGK